VRALHGHPGESRDPEFLCLTVCGPWVPAFAGMTIRG
jgi:hypothetical protein